MNLKRLTVSVLLIIIITSLGAAGYYISRFSTSPQVLWDSRGVFTHYENVTVPRNVSVSIPVVTFSLDMNNKSKTAFSQALYNDIEEILKADGFSPKFIGEEMDFSIPGVSTLKPNGPVVIVFIPFYGQENYSLYRECYASVILYMNSNPDVESYLAMVTEYSRNNSKEIDDLGHLANWVFKKAQTNETEPYSLDVVYWNTLKVRMGNNLKKSCWKTLAGEIGKEVDDWAKTLKPSDKP
ncbi:hypothetical protein [Thermococcus sp.]